ncbi:hypothetical protein AgCh_038209 [Apium graveolens]
MGFVRCPYKHGVYVKRKGTDSLIVGVYVDDLLVTGSSVELIQDFKNQMNSVFEMSDMGKLSYYLGIEDGGNNVLTGYSDSDLAGNLDDRKSTGAMAFYLNESLVTWVSQKQRCVALSSCEAEFMAATAATCQGIWLRNVLMQVTGEQLGPVVIYIDNRSAIDLAKNPVFHGRSKYIDIRFHFIRECIEQGDIVVKHVSSDNQRADILTKALVTVKFERLRRLLGMKELDKQV